MEVSHKFPSLSQEPKDKNSIPGVTEVSPTLDCKIVLERVHFLYDDYETASSLCLTFMEDQIAQCLITQ